MADYTKSCTEIISAVGGMDNIISVTHCATRLRLVLKDKKLYDPKVIDAIEGVQGLFYNAGQLQIIFGLMVPNVYKTFIKVSGINEEAMKSIPPQKIGLAKATLRAFPGVIMPIIGILTSCGMIAVIMAILQLILSESGVTIDSNPWYLLFNNIGSIVTSFFCMFACISAARYWKVNYFIATAIGLFLVAGPALGTLIPHWSTYNIDDYGNLPYYSSILTAMVAIKFCSWIEHWLDKKVNDNLKMFLVAGVSVTFTLLFTLLLFGPIMLYFQELLSIISKGVTNPNLYGIGIAFLSCVCAPIVITGMHSAFTPIILANLYGAMGYDPLIVFMFASNIAQGAAAIACAIRSKDPKVKSLGFSSGLVAIFGITEPAMFGVNLRNRRAFFSAMIGAFFGGWFMGLMNVSIMQMTGMAGVTAILFGIPVDDIQRAAGFTYMNAVWMAVGMAISFTITIVIALIWLGFKPKHKDNWFNKQLLNLKLGYYHTIEKINDSKTLEFYRNTKREAIFLVNKKEKLKYYYPTMPKLNHVDAPTDGYCKPLSEVNDPVFSSGSMGIGFAIDSTNGIIKAPFTGEVTMLFQTNHAIGLKSNDGIEILIHIGIDTVKLDGRYFKSYVAQGDLVKEGAKLIKFNPEKIKKKNFDPTVIVVITNQDTTKNYQLVFNKNSSKQVDNKSEMILVS